MVDIAQNAYGECHAECRTIEYACNTAMKHMSDRLFQQLLSPKANERRVPKELCATVCQAAPPRLASYARDEPFIAQDPGERNSAEISEAGLFGFV